MNKHQLVASAAFVLLFAAQQLQEYLDIIVILVGLYALGSLAITWWTVASFTQLIGKIGELLGDLIWTGGNTMKEGSANIKRHLRPVKAEVISYEDERELDQPTQSQDSGLSIFDAPEGDGLDVPDFVRS